MLSYVTLNDTVYSEKPLKCCSLSCRGLAHLFCDVRRRLLRTKLAQLLQDLLQKPVQT